MKIIKFMKKNWLCCLLVALAGCFILFSHPFFKLPYDMWEMIMRIESIFYTGNDFTFFPLRDSSKYNLWPWCWAKIFIFFNISDPFAWGYIIHVTQIFILSASLFFFCYTVLSLLLPKNKDDFLLAFISMLLWFVGTGTFSMQYQQAWIMWYSVNYQCISMAILWICAALTLIVLYKDLNWKIKVIIGSLIVPLFVLGLFIHSMEMGFYLIFLAIFAIFKIKKIPSFKNINKKSIILSGGAISLLIIVSGFLYWIISNNIIYTPWSRHLASLKSFSSVWKSICDSSEMLTFKNLNRFPSSFGELALLSIISGVILSFTIPKINRENLLLKKRIFYMLFSLASLFALIPIIPGLNGFFALLTHQNVVYRFFYVSPWFFFIPLSFYLLLKKSSNQKYFNLKFISSIIVLLITIALGSYILSVCLSPFTRNFHPPFYGNVISILNSLDSEKVGCQYSKNDIACLKKIIEKKEKKTTLKPLFYIRGDWGPILATIPGKHVLAYSRLKLHYNKNLTYYKKFIKRYKNKAKDKKWKYYKRYHIYLGIVKKFEGYEIINIDLPADFPRDETIFEYFPEIEKPSDRVVNIESEGKGGEIVDGRLLMVNEKKAEKIVDGKYREEYRLVQSFKYVSRIARIQLLLENPNNTTKNVILKIKESPNLKNSIAEIKINEATITKKDWYTFKFPNYIYLNRKNTYYIVLESPKSLSENAITLYTNNSIKYKYGALCVNGKKTNENMCMRIWKGY